MIGKDKFLILIFPGLSLSTRQRYWKTVKEIGLSLLSLRVLPKQYSMAIS